MPPDTRTALIDAATRLLDRGGVEAVTLREVGRLAGVSHNAPYKHFASKEALLAVLAARELDRQSAGLAHAASRSAGPEVTLRRALHEYVRWASAHPARFKLVFGRWTVDSAELAEAAETARAGLLTLVETAQRAGALPAGDPDRLAALLRALAHGAADLASAGHLSAGGKGNADPEDLVDDLLAHLRAAARG
jgi:AcrR family transcriptional regulator